MWKNWKKSIKIKIIQGQKKRERYWIALKKINKSPIYPKIFQSSWIKIINP